MTQFNEVVEHPEAPIRPTVYALLVALTGQQRKGHELGQAAASTTGGVVQLGPGTLYRTLQRMRVEGLIEEVDGQDPKKAHTDPQTEGLRDYRITDAGRRALEAMASRMSVLTDSATSKGVKARREAAAARKNGKPAPLPEEFNSVLPHIIVSDAAAAADFYKKAFDADELYRDSGPDGRIWHLELLSGNTRLPLC